MSSRLEWKGQSARLIEPPVIAIRITANANACGKIARGRPWNCHHLIRKLLHVENCRIYYTPLPRRLKRGYKLRFKRTSIAEKGRSDADNQTEKRSSCIYKDSLHDALMNLKPSEEGLKIDGKQNGRYYKQKMKRRKNAVKWGWYQRSFRCKTFKW